jgi:hypothetical protein
MACVTLKRPIDVLGSPHLAEIAPLAKRKRCGPPLFAATPSSPAGRGVKRAKRRLDVDEAYSPNSGPASPVPSPFVGAVPPVEPDKLAARMELEFKRLQRRKLFMANSDSGPSSIPNSPGSSSSTGTGQASSSNKDQPLFTLKQVTMVCQRMLKEREEQVCVEFGKILETKLAEQYDTFVKFTHDQVERRLAESAFSYVS